MGMTDEVELPLKTRQDLTSNFIFGQVGYGFSPQYSALAVA